MSKRQAILDAAVELFVRQGVENTPTAQISKVSGVATGTLFHHFANKDALLRALVLETKGSLFQAVQAQMAEASDFRERIEAIWRAYVGWAMAHPLLFRFKAQMDSLVRIDPDTQQQLDSMWGTLSDFVASGIASGVFKPFPRDYLFEVLEAQVALAARYFSDHPEQFDDDGIRSLAFESLWDSVAV